MAHDFRDFEHLLRMAAIFVAGAVLFIVVRGLLVPEDFGVYGHFRAGALDDNRQRPLVHAGAEAYLTVRRARRGEKAPLSAVHRWQQ